MDKDERTYSEVYNQMYYIFEGIAENDTSAVDDLTSIFTLTNNWSVAKYKSWDFFKLKNRQRINSDFYAMKNYFESDEDKKIQDLFIKSLSDYIRRLESYRYGESKIKTLVVYIMYQGLYGLLSRVYIPEHIKELVNNYIDSNSKYLEDLLVSIRDHFKWYNNPKLDQVLLSMGSQVLQQRTDQVITNLKKYCENLEDSEYYFLSDSRTEYLKRYDTPELKTLFEFFELAQSTYRTNLGVIISDLYAVLDEDSLALLNELFLRR